LHATSSIFAVRGGIFAFEPGVDRQEIVEELEELLPLAAQWVTEQRQRALCAGVPLSETELADARAVGVQNPERIRLLRVETIPVPAHPMLRAAAVAMRFLPTSPRGLALDDAIFVRADYWRDRSLIAHELAHTAQYQKLGGILPFLRTYISQCAIVGYPNAPLELEAEARSKRACSA
jgi:hypothetical protein